MPRTRFQQVGERAPGNHGSVAARTAAVTCFSFYANKTITTGEGGMAVTNDQDLAERMRVMSLHGLLQDAWQRYSGGSSWTTKIIAPGFKYNLTDIAAALGIHQLARAEEMRTRATEIARFYLQALADIPEIELPGEDPDRLHAWHLFRLSSDSNVCRSIAISLLSS